MCARRGQGKVFGVREPQRASSVAAEAWRCARLKFARSRQYLDAGQARFVGGQFGGAHNLHQRRHAASIGGVHVRIVLEQVGCRYNVPSRRMHARSIADVGNNAAI